MHKSDEKLEIVLEEKHLIEKYNNKSELPKKIRLEASTICQLNCACCYMKCDKKGAKNGCKLGFLAFKDFKKIVNDNDFTEIELSNSGEIFLNPELPKIIEYAYRRDIKLTAYNGVNLNTLSDEMAKILVKYQFEALIVSIDGASQESYSKYRINGNYEQVIANIKKINAYKEEYNSAKPNIKWKFIVFGHNEHEIIKAKEEAAKLGVEIFFELSWDNDFSPIVNKDLILKETNISHIEELTEKIMLDQQEDESKWFYCNFLWEQPQINWDGQVLGCCSMYKDNFGGNAFEDGLLNALNHPKLIYAKNMLTKNAAPIDGIPCTNCWCFKKIQEKHFVPKSFKTKNTN